MQDTSERFPMLHIVNEGYEHVDRSYAAKGKYIKINDRWCLDLANGAGANIFGHNNGSKYKSNLFIAPNHFADKAAEYLHEATGFDKFCFCNSGSEATLRAIRLARAYTNRIKILVFDGCWHGTHDYNLALYSQGIPQVIKDMVICMPPDQSALDRLDEKDIAICMIEPIQAALPIDRKDFLWELKKKCTATGTVLCFDEIISGFRVALGGATELFSIKPDLVCYGKIIGGGFPIGVVGGDVIMDMVGSVRMGGTFSANPVTMKSCIDVLEKLIGFDYNYFWDICKELNTIKTKSLQIMEFFGMAKLLYTAEKINSIKERDRLEVSVSKDYIRQELLKRDIYIASNNNIMFSIKNNLKDVKVISEALHDITE